MKFSAIRRLRAKPFHGEFHRHWSYTFLNFGIASRTRHAWWAVSVWVYFSKRESNAICSALLRIDLLREKFALWRSIRRCSEDGMVAMVNWGMDCDCSRWENAVTYLDADLRKVTEWIDRFNNNAEGPQGYRVERPSVAIELRRASRDLALEAFENGHPHSIRY